MLEMENTELARALLRMAPELAAEIARCCEQAYRRGYRQGALYGKGLELEVSDWRFTAHDDAMPKYAMAIKPPDTRGPGWGLTCSSLERLSMEAGSASGLVSSLCTWTDDCDETSTPEWQ